jgi:hypothetical protein
VEENAHTRRAHAALDRLLAEVLLPGKTGLASLVLVIKDGGLVEPRLTTDFKDIPPPAGAAKT